MSEDEIEYVMTAVFERSFRPYVPIDTGNMRFNATNVKRIGNIKHGECRDFLQIKVDSRIAPYVVYTNEPWISQKWNGRRNPHQKWFEQLTKTYAERLAATLGGRLITVKDVDVV